MPSFPSQVGARNLVREPLDPYGFEMDTLSGKASAMAYADPPLVPLYTALLLRLFGEKEIAFHLGFIAFPLIAAISLYHLSKRFVPYPTFTTLIVVSTPTFMVNSHLIMQDIPLMAFFLLALLLYIKGSEKNKGSLLAAAAIFAGMAFLIKYNGLLVVLLMILYSLIIGKPKHLKYLGITLVIIAAFFIHNLYYYVSIHLFTSLSLWIVGSKGIANGLISWLKTVTALFIANLNYIGGATIFFPFLLWPFAKNKKNKFALIACSLISLVISIALFFISLGFVSGQYTLLQLTLFFIFVASGLFIIWVILFDNRNQISKFIYSLRNLKFDKMGKNEKPAIFLLIWFAVVFVFNFTIAGGSTRYNTLLLAPFAMLLILNAAKYFRAADLKNYLKTVTATTLLLGLALAFSDYQYMETYRKIPDIIPSAHSEGKVFFLGHEGFKYYMEKNGGIFLNSYEGKVDAGDIIIVAPLASPAITEPIKSRLNNPNLIEFNTLFPVRILNADAHAGFYKYGAGFLPFSISNAPIEKFEVYTVGEEFIK